MNMERIYIVYDVVKKDWIIEIMTINKIHKKSSSVKYMAHISISFFVNCSGRTTTCTSIYITYFRLHELWKYFGRMWIAWTKISQRQVYRFSIPRESITFITLSCQRFRTLDYYILTITYFYLYTMSYKWYYYIIFK